MRHDLLMAKCGLVPYSTKSENAAKPLYSTINAQAETISDCRKLCASHVRQYHLIPAIGVWDRAGALLIHLR